MPDYENMYFRLFREITKAIKILQEAQIKTEEMYLFDDVDGISSKIPREEHTGKIDLPPT